VTLGEPDPCGAIIIHLWAAYLTDVGKAWDNAAESSAVPPSGESPLSPQLYFTRSTQASSSPAPALVDPSPEEHAPGRPRREFFGGSSLLHASSRAIVRSPGCCRGVARGSKRIDGTQEPPESVDPIIGTGTPNSDCWRTLKPATVGAFTLLVQPNPFGAHPFKAVRDALRPPSVALQRPQNLLSNLKPEKSREHVLVSLQTKQSVECVLACPQPESPFVRDRACFPPEPLEPPVNVHVSPPTEEMLENVLVAPPTEESLETLLISPLTDIVAIPRLTDIVVIPL